MSQTQSLRDLKDTLLKFASSELTSHAANVLAIGVILFSYLNIIYPDFQVECNLSSPLIFKPTFNFIVVFCVFWILNSGIIFSTLRLVYYGGIAHEIIYFSGTATDISQLSVAVANKLANKTFFKIPLKLFSSGISESKGGIYFALLLGLIVSGILFFTFLVK